MISSYKALYSNKPSNAAWFARGMEKLSLSNLQLGWNRVFTIDELKSAVFGLPSDKALARLIPYVLLSPLVFSKFHPNT